jgi:EAL domain-containing protein (putative c-di-GMP-specific phosphodiesterase class I)
MTQLPPNHEIPSAVLAALARGLMRRAPEILSLSIHDSRGHALWSSGDFLLAEDHALIAEMIEQCVVDEPYSVRGQSSGLWWESADTARARCALALHEGSQFAGVVLAVFSGLTTHESDRADRVVALSPAIPVLARAVQNLVTEPMSLSAVTAGTDTEEVATLQVESSDPNDSLVQDLAALAREEKLLGLIDHALREDEFALHLQPIASLRDDNSPLIVEVLLRLPTTEGVLESHQFLDTAEDHGRMPAIDRWVIRALLVWMQRNRDRWTDANAVFSVNLSGKSVVRPDFRNYLESCLDKSGLPLTSLRFEVAELDAGIAPQEFAALARALIERGCEVSVDNVGTGSGRFEFLREVNADLLKIDGSLVRGSSDDILSRALINGLVHMADTLGMRTVASQVDSTGQLRAVAQLGVDFAQGYRVRRPSHIDEFEFLSCGIQLAATGTAHA